MDLSQRRRRRPRRSRRSRAGARTARPPARARVLQRPIADRAAHADARRRAGRRRRSCAGGSRRRSRSGRRSRSMRPRTGWCTAKPISCRRSSSIATATTWSCRRCRRAWIGCCRSSSSELLDELLQPRGILARNDPRARLLEGLEQRVDVLAGEVPEIVTVTELGIEYDVDLRHGQKTGLFLDQRENRAAAALYARGRLLDCFSYTRRLRAGARAPVPGGHRASTSPRTPCARDGERRAQRRRDRRARRQCVRRAARPRAAGRAVRHDRARPAGVREEQGRRREGPDRLQGDQPARVEAAQSRAARS